MIAPHVLTPNKVSSILLAATLLLFAATTQAIQITSFGGDGYLLVQSKGGTGPVTPLPGEFDQITPAPTTLPYSHTHTSAAPNGSATATAIYNFTNTSTQALMDFDLSLGFINGYFTYASGSVAFTLAETVNYLIQGSMTGSGNDQDDEYRHFLRLIGDGGDIFNEGDVAISNVANLQFGDGDYNGGTIGSVSGTLSPGDYRIFYQSRVAATGIGVLYLNTTASALANISLKLTPLHSQVPAPGVLPLLAIGLAGFAFRRQSGKEMA